jgi:UMF1 family MFS transporter
MLVALSPPETIGAFFGFFTLTEKVSIGVGPALTAAMLFIFGTAPSGT